MTQRQGSRKAHRLPPDKCTMPVEGKAPARGSRSHSGEKLSLWPKRSRTAFLHRGLGLHSPASPLPY